MENEKGCANLILLIATIIIAGIAIKLTVKFADRIDQSGWITLALLGTLAVLIFIMILNSKSGKDEYYN